jgi:hypothetical protein
VFMQFDRAADGTLTPLPARTQAWVWAKLPVR